MLAAQVALLIGKILVNSEKAFTATKAKAYPAFDLGNGPT